MRISLLRVVRREEKKRENKKSKRGERDGYPANRRNTYPVSFTPCLQLIRNRLSFERFSIDRLGGGCSLEKDASTLRPRIENPAGGLTLSPRQLHLVFYARFFPRTFLFLSLSFYVFSFSLFFFSLEFIFQIQVPLLFPSFFFYFLDDVTIVSFESCTILIKIATPFHVALSLGTQSHVIASVINNC